MLSSPSHGGKRERGSFESAASPEGCDVVSVTQPSTSKSLSQAFAKKRMFSLSPQKSASRDNDQVQFWPQSHDLVESEPTPFSRAVPSLNSCGSNSSSNTLVRTKLFNCPIHQAIKLDSLSLLITDTPEFQRLSQLKQLGTCSYVFRGATHTRFEHSIGVAHLAERMCRTLQQHQPELEITEEDVLCVKVAALCHDLGHGPFSHVYDGVFIKLMWPRGLDNKGKKWRHEDGSVMMFHHLLEANDINLASFGLTEKDLRFIDEIIGGVPDEERRGRAPCKYFLYDIVNNTRSGLDVDKLDYFQRDMRMSNVQFGGSHMFDRFIELGRVLRATPLRPIISSMSGRSKGIPSAPTPAASGIMSDSDTDTDGAARFASTTGTPVDLPTMICYPEKLVSEALDVFSVRFRMHKAVYTHKSVKAVEFMITDALRLADPYIVIPGKVTARHPDGNYRMSECVLDVEALSHLDDSVIPLIKNNSNPALKEAKAILGRVDSRKLYLCLGRSPFKRGDVIFGKKEGEIADEICSIAGQLAGLSQMTSTLDDDIDMYPLSQADSPTKGSSSSVVSFQPIGTEDDSRFSFCDKPAADAEWLSQLISTEDIIVEKMHLHYGLKEQNPVARMRFFPRKCAHDAIGREISEHKYEASLPRVFEEMAVRVFCRSQEKEAAARRAFHVWCKRQHSPSPFPASQFESSGDN